MRALVVFHNNGTHPLSFLLKEGFKHVFVVVEVNRYWISVDGKEGVLGIDTVVDTDYDLITFYEDHGFTVVETEQCEAPNLSPLSITSCVGLVKAVLSMRSMAITPWQLYKHLRRERT